MRKFVSHSILLFVINFTLFNQLFSQIIDFKNVIQYTSKQGFNGNNIHKILKDYNGFLWIASQDGLFRFEGKEFIMYNKGELPKRNLLSTDIRDIIYDSTQRLLWTICNQTGINAIDLTTGDVKYAFQYPTNVLANSWRICAGMIGNRIFIGTSGGIEIFDIVAKQFLNSSEKIIQLFNSNNLNDIRSLNIDPKGNIWVGVMDTGIVIVDPKNIHIKSRISAAVILSKNERVSFWPVCGVFVGDSSYLVGTKNGLYALKYDNNYNISPKKYNSAFGGGNSHEIGHLYIRGNELFIAANDFFTYNFSSQILRQLKPDKVDADPWIKNITYTFYDTTNNNLWLGCREGLILMKNKQPFLLPVQTNKIERYKIGHIYSILVLKENRILLGTQNGLYELTNNRQIRGLKTGGIIQNLFRIYNNEIIISGSEGLSLLINDQILPIEKKHPEFYPYKLWQCNSAANLNDSIIIVGTESNQGVLYWNIKNQTIKVINENKKGVYPFLVSNTINKVFKQYDSNVCVLSDFAISVFDKKYLKIRNINLLNKETGKPFSILMDITETSKNYWVAAYGEGLLKLDKNYKVVRKYNNKDGLSNNGVYKIFNFQDSLLIITTNQGISVFEIGLNKFSTFHEEDGLQNNTFEEACGDIYKGKFYGGGVNGFSIINPSHFSLNPIPPVVFISRVTIETKSMKLDTSNFVMSEITVPNNVLQTTIKFSAINWTSPGRVAYSWRIVENSLFWTDIGDQNFINLIGLNPGKYHLQIKASNENGVSSLPKEIILKFMPKWNQTLWFKLLILITIIGFIYALYTYRINQIKKQHEIRKSIATDLHDDLGSTLNSVKMFTNLAISGVKQEESLQQIKDNLNAATIGLRDMIWVLDDSLDTVDEMITRIKYFANPYAKINNIELKIKSDTETAHLKLSKEEKRNLYLLTKEAINNSLKYSSAKEINIHISSLKKGIKVEINDDGKGFNTNEVKGGYGLKNMLYRANQIHYKLLLNSIPGKGTSVILQPL